MGYCGRDKTGLKNWKENIIFFIARYAVLTICPILSSISRAQLISQVDYDWPSMDLRHPFLFASHSNSISADKQKNAGKYSNRVDDHHPQKTGCMVILKTARPYALSRKKDPQNPFIYFSSSKKRSTEPFFLLLVCYFIVTIHETRFSLAFPL